MLSQTKPLLDAGTLNAAMITSLTMDTAMEMLVRHIQSGSQPPEHTFVKAWSQPALEDLVKQYSYTFASSSGAPFDLRIFQNVTMLRVNSPTLEWSPVPCWIEA